MMELNKKKKIDDMIFDNRNWSSKDIEGLKKENAMCKAFIEKLENHIRDLENSIKNFNKVNSIKIKITEFYDTIKF